MYIKSSAWVDEFQPQSLEECFLPNDTKIQLKQIISSGEVPSLFFTGPAGIGKTTTALVICKELELEYMMINASLYGNIDTIRTDIQAFASTIAFNGKKKVIILDEADWLSAAAQASLRGVINEFTDNAAFILTANYRNKIIEPIISRLVEVDFLFTKQEMPVLAQGLYHFIIGRLEAESVEYDNKAVQIFLKDSLSKSTDIRKILINAQKIAKTGTFSTDSLINSDDQRLTELVDLVKSRNFDQIRTWVGENSDLDFGDIMRYLYDNLKSLPGADIPTLVMIINQYQYQHAFVIDKEINTTAMLAEISKML